MIKKTSTLNFNELSPRVRALFNQELNGISESRSELSYEIQCPEYSDVEIYTMYAIIDCQDWIICVKVNQNYVGWESCKTFQI